MPFAGRGLTQMADNCFIHLGTVAGQQTAMQVVGRIYRQATGDRGFVPKCLNDFEAGGTPFAFGHVMALELGGCDTRENIVPQYGQWQGNQLGAWRQMEIAIGNRVADADVFIADITYGGGPFVESYDEQQVRFSDGDKLFHWTEARIPVRFRVWSVANGWTATGGIGIANYFAANAGGKDTSIGPLIAALPDTHKRFDETITAMPDIDRRYWRLQMLNKFARVEHGKYESVIKKDNRHKEKTLEKMLASGGSRVSGRLALKDPAHFVSKPVVPMGLAKWLQDDSEMGKVVARLQDTTNPSSAVTGWSPTELALITAGLVRSAVFQV
jgi:hypothetical protein